MVTGAVNAQRDAIIRVTVLDRRGQPHEFDALMDTGFDGSLTLPSATIALLGLAWRNRSRVTLANGKMEKCDFYTGQALWEGQSRNTLIEAADTDPLVGMRLMAGYRITIDNVDGRPVALERI